MLRGASRSPLRKYKPEMMMPSAAKNPTIPATPNWAALMASYRSASSLSLTALSLR